MNSGTSNPSLRSNSCTGVHAAQDTRESTDRLQTAAPVPPVVQQVCRPVRQQRVSLHLAKADAAAKLATLDGLPSQGVDGAGGPHLQGKQQQLCALRLGTGDGHQPKLKAVT